MYGRQCTFSIPAAEAVDSDAAEHREKDKCHVVERGTLRAKMGMNADPQDAKIVVGVNLREGEVSTETSMDRGNGRMRSGMSNIDGAYEKVIHVKAILSTSLPNIREDPLRRAGVRGSEP
jgi:hypothetical protein